MVNLSLMCLSNGARKSFGNIILEKIGYRIDKYASHLGKYIKIRATRV